ncbi:DUF488 domain-containing protein [Burkholderia cenocepacia]|uniref:DUF488 domain-containing protein n=1 Tax=Burkholderia cenocepacia TaxID=95486 RepID=UPI0019036DE0|nr:DUF488 family protein [Burkholderia cenocepacia]MBJ9696828.1 DUF488 family protein [Burkholderia cenocepacia]
MKHAIDIQRVYEHVGDDGHVHFLVDRLWPRGIKKESVKLDGWLKEVAPSNELRDWFGHDPQRWDEFRRRYERELDVSPASWQPILDAARKKPVTLFYGARDTEHNQAVVLRDYLMCKLQRH